MALPRVGRRAASSGRRELERSERVREAALLRIMARIAASRATSDARLQRGPAAAARRLSSSPEQMAVLASLLGMLAVSGGLALSWFYDTPTGPSIVLIASALFFLLFCFPRSFRLS